ncbi:alpha/beta fold hydrolase [Spongiimicrobium salis]|uniref:alpha/beta fold hydrolase n=1 Tax=Spongiimicrobium salis TaxID=1667022 RepID=UPI00374CCD2A
MKKTLQKYLPLLYGLYLKILVIFARKKAAKTAYHLFCTPRKGRVLEEQRSFLDGAKDQRLAFNHHSIQTYKWSGGEKTVLLMHGWESNSFRWWRLIPRLQEEGYTIIAMDAPGHGYSSGTCLNLLVYAKCAQKVIETYNPQYIIGHSMGGMTLVYHQYKYPNAAIEKIISLGAPSELPEIMAQFKQILNLNQRVMQALDDYFMTHFGFHIQDFSTSKYAKELHKKGLLIHDELDAIAPVSCSERVHANWKDSTLIKTKGLGHSLHQDGVRDRIIAFLKS